MSEHPDDSAQKRGFLSLPVIRDILIVVAILVVGWKAAASDLKLDLSAFSFTDLLALIMSLFSVWLSVAFYFKATDASNQFYDNTYRFTKEMSEILGRIEAGFGERLRHLDEGYSGIRDRFDRLPYYEQATSDELKKEEAEVKLKEQEQRALLDELTKRAKLVEHEKSSFLQALSQKTKELEEAKAELRGLKATTHSSPHEAQERRAVLRYIAQVVRAAMPDGTDSKSPSTSVQKVFASIANSLPRGAINDLERLDLLDGSGNLTREAIERIRIEMKRS